MTYLMRMFLAVSLLTSERMPSEAEFMFANPVLVAIGRQEEVLGPVETLEWRELKSFRSNLREFQYAPPLSASYLIVGINSADTEKALEFNRSYLEHLCVKQQLFQPRMADELCLLKRAVSWHWDAWDALDGVVKSTRPVWKRRWMVKLINCIGEEAFYRGEMPFPIPQWALEEIR